MSQIPTMKLFSELFGVMIMMQAIALPTVAGTNKVAEMQLKFWREKLPSVQVPETVAASMSPLTQEEMTTFIKIIKAGNLRFHATQFCNSAHLLCYQSVDLVDALWAIYPGVGDIDLSKTSTNVYISAEKLKEGEQITLPNLYSPWKAFLPRNLSQLFPFSMAAFPDVVSSFGMPERSNMTENINSTLNKCEDEPIEGENKTCTTSIEGMIEFVLSNVASSDSLQLVSHPPHVADSGKKARVTKVTQIQSGPSNRPPIACHRLVYPYGVFYCHYINGTLAFTMELEVLEKHGNMYNTTALCHSKEVVNCHLVFGGDTLLWFNKDEH